MTRPTDTNIARAFWELCDMQMNGFVDADSVTNLAEQFDAESAAGPVRHSEEVMQIEPVQTGPHPPVASGADSKAAPPYDRCPKCTAHFPPGMTCGGEFCGLKRCSHLHCGTPEQLGACEYAECPRKST